MRTRETVAEFYSGKTIFLTGASGFIGKVLIWKLLQNCSNLDTIYILIRPKYGKNVQSRVEELLQAPIFNNFKKESPQLLSKVKAVAGNIAEENLGLSDDDERTLIDSVQIVFHIAAILKLDADLKDAVNMNTTGTLRLLKIAEKMSKLQAFIHTSTAYCHCDVPVMGEKTYKPNESACEVMEMVRWMKPEILDSFSDKLIKPHPNTYTYSKRLAENVVTDFYPKLPIAIARPSIVIPAWEEPLPGWVDNLNGPTGLMMGAGKGVIRTMWCNGQYNADLIPVDIICNSLIVVAWKIATDIESERPPDIPVYNLTQMEMEPTTWQEIVDLGKKLTEVYPFTQVLWYPGGDIHSNYYVHTILAFLFHWLPAYLIDALLFIFGHKRFMIRAQQKIHHGQKVLQYFTTREWEFVKDNILALREMLSEEDKKTYKLTTKGLNREDFLKNAMLVVRHYILKEDPDSLPQARTKLKMLYYLDRFVTLMFWLFVAWLSLRFVDMFVGVNRNDKTVFA